MRSGILLIALILSLGNSTGISNSNTYNSNEIVISNDNIKHTTYYKEFYHITTETIDSKNKAILIEDDLDKDNRTLLLVKNNTVYLNTLLDNKRIIYKIDNINMINLNEMLNSFNIKPLQISNIISIRRLVGGRIDINCNIENGSKDDDIDIYVNDIASKIIRIKFNNNSTIKFIDFCKCDKLSINEDEFKNAQEVSEEEFLTAAFMSIFNLSGVE